MNAMILPALSFCLVIAGAILTFAVRGGHVDRTDVGVTMMLLGGLAFVLTASRLWFMERRDRQLLVQSTNTVVVAAVSFFLATVGAVITFAIQAGHVNRTALGVTLMLFGGLAFALSSGRLRFIDRHRREHDGREKQELPAAFVVLSFFLVIAGAIFAFAIRGGGIAVGVVLMLLGGLAFVLTAGQQWSIDRNSGPRPSSGRGPSAPVK